MHMGNVERVDKTLPTNEMLYYTRKDAGERKRWITDMDNVSSESRLG